MTATPLAALVLADEPIQGVAARVAAIPDSEGDDAAGARLQEELAAEGLPLPAERGVPDVARRIVSRLRGQRLVDELGELDASFELLGLHVPPAGRAGLILQRSAVTDRSVSLTALGLGFGGGRKLTVAIDEDIPERDTCMRVLQHVVLRVRRFVTGADGTEPLVTTDVVSWGPQELAARSDCPYCGAAAGEPDPLDFEEDRAQALDLRSFDGPVTRQTAYTLEGTRNADVGLAVPVPGGATVQGGFKLEQRIELKCTASYTFPPGRLFVPYRRRDAGVGLPYWAVA